jgi:hypothetical protein
MANINAGVAAGNAANATAITGGLLGGAGAFLGMGSGGGALKPNPYGASGGSVVPGGVLPPSDGPESDLGRYLMGMAKGGPVFMADGGVPGTAPVPGDSRRNDVVPAALSPGEIVIPRSHAGSPEAAASFVAALQARQGGYGRVADARAMCNGGQAYAEGGEVEEPGFGDKARAWAEKVKGFTLADAADALPDVLGGKVRKQAKDRQAAVDAAGKE